MTNLIVVPTQVFTPEVVERRKPLAASARRAAAGARGRETGLADGC